MDSKNHHTAINWVQIVIELNTIEIQLGIGRVLIGHYSAIRKSIGIRKIFKFAN